MTSPGGKRVTGLFANLPSPSTAQPSTKMKNPTCAGAGCVCADCHVHPEEQVVVRPLSANFRECPRLSAIFREFPRLPANFRDFQRLSATFRQFPRLSAPFVGAVEKYPAIFRTISANVPRLSANSRSAVCAAWAWSHCAVDSGSAPGGRCGCCSTVRPMEGFPQQQSRLLKCEQEMPCMTTIKYFLGLLQCSEVGQ